MTMMNQYCHDVGVDGLVAKVGRQRRMNLTKDVKVLSLQRVVLRGRSTSSPAQYSIEFIHYILTIKILFEIHTLTKSLASWLLLSHNGPGNFSSMLPLLCR